MTGEWVAAAHRRCGFLLERKRGREGAGSGARIDVQLTLTLVSAKDVGVAGDEDVAIELALQRAQRLRVAPRHHLVPVAQAELELANLHSLVLGQRIGDIWQEDAIVKVAADDVHVGRERAQVVVRLLVYHVARAQNVLDLSWLQQRLKLLWQVGRTHGDVHIADDEDEHHGES